MGAYIRRAELADGPALGALHSFCWSELYGSVLSPEVLGQLNPDMMANLWEKFLTRGEVYKQWVAVVDDEIVGFAGVGPGREPEDAGSTELYFIYVAPAVRRTGIGRTLLEAAKADYMWVWDGNPKSQKFYKKEKYKNELVSALRGRAPRRRLGSLFGTPIYELRFIR